MKYGDIIIFDNRNSQVTYLDKEGQIVSFPQTSCLLTWSKHLEELFPPDGTYWAVGVVRKATEGEIETVRWGVEELRGKER